MDYYNEKILAVLLEKKANMEQAIEDNVLMIENCIARAEMAVMARAKAQDKYMDAKDKATAAYDKAINKAIERRNKEFDAADLAQEQAESEKKLHENLIPSIEHDLAELNKLIEAMQNASD